MSRINSNSVEKIQANILRILYDEAPKAISANSISEMEIRDKQFILRLLKDLERKKLVKNVTSHFSRKSYWIMTESTYKKYDELL
ncbi:MAG: hypothetical protein ABIJ18_04980 [archaeon]